MADQVLIEPLDHGANVVRRIRGLSADPLTVLDMTREPRPVATAWNLQELDFHARLVKSRFHDFRLLKGLSLVNTRRPVKSRTYIPLEFRA